ncbi:SNF2-related protein, partial [Bacteroides heparinolyticus]
MSALIFYSPKSFTGQQYINYEKIRKPKKQKSDDKDAKAKHQKETLADYLQASGKHIDLLVCDEAHRARNHDTQTFKGLKSIIDSTKAVIFLTATPIMISRENLFNLLRLLNDTEYTSYSIFENALRVNEPFIRALGRLNNRDNFASIAKELEETEVTTITEIGEYKYPEIATIAERFKDIPLYKVIIDTLKKGKATDEARVQLQFDISSLSKMNNIFS